MERTTGYVHAEISNGAPTVTSGQLTIGSTLTAPHLGVCPSCGHCPHCGRGGQQAIPYPLYPSAPWYQPGTFPSWPYGWITYTTADTQQGQNR